MLYLGTDLFDRVEIGLIFRQAPQLCSCGLDGGPDGFGFVAAEVVHDDDIAGVQRPDQLLTNIINEIPSKYPCLCRSPT